MDYEDTHTQSHEDWLISRSLRLIMHTEEQDCLGLKIRFTKDTRPGPLSVWREMQS